MKTATFKVGGQHAFDVRVQINESGTFHDVTIYSYRLERSRGLTSLYDVIDEYKIYSKIIDELLNSPHLSQQIKEKLIEAIKD